MAGTLGAMLRFFARAKRPRETVACALEAGFVWMEGVSCCVLGRLACGVGNAQMVR